MPYSSQLEADAAFSSFKTTLNQRLAAIAGGLGRAKADLEKLKISWSDSTAEKLDDELASVLLDMESYKTNLLKMRDQKLIDQAQVDKAMEPFFRAMDAMQAIAGSITEMNNWRRQSNWGKVGILVSQLISYIANLVSEFARITGITAALKNIWEKVKDPLGDLGGDLGTIIKWLPWIALGVGGAIVLPWVLKSWTAARALNNPPRRRRGRRKTSLRSRRRRKDEGASVLPILLVGGGVAAVAAGVFSEKKQAPAAAGDEILAGSVALGQSAAQVKIRLDKVSIPYRMIDTGQLFEFYVPRANFTSANNIVRAVREEYRELETPLPAAA